MQPQEQQIHSLFAIVDRKGEPMRKQIFTNAEKRIAVVVLTNEANGICVRGKAICHETDTWNEELGISIANTRAWDKYYQKLSKAAEDDLKFANIIVAKWTDEVNRLTYIKDLADRKQAEIKTEYEKIMKEI